MCVRTLVECVKSLYGGIESMDVIAALEDGVLTAEEGSAVAAVVREDNYRRLLAGSAERARQEALRRLDQRREALRQDVPAGMVLRGSKWVRIA